MKSDPREQYKDEASGGARFTVTFWTPSEYGFSVLIGKKDRFVPFLKVCLKNRGFIEKLDEYIDFLNKNKQEKKLMETLRMTAVEV